MLKKAKKNTLKMVLKCELSHQLKCNNKRVYELQFHFKKQNRLVYYAIL